MDSGRCKATYTRRQWRIEHDGDPIHDELFEPNGKWHCPREALGDTDRCLFHLDRAEREERDDLDDDDLAKRLIKELRGDHELASDGYPGELLGAELGSLEFTPEVVDDEDSIGDNIGSSLYIVGTTLNRLKFDDVTLGCDLTLDGVEIGRFGHKNGRTSDRKDGNGEVDPFLVQDSKANTITVASTQINGRAEISGSDTTLKELQVRAGTNLAGSIKVCDGATVEDAINVEGTGDRLGGIVVSGATVNGALNVEGTGDCLEKVVINKGAAIGDGDDETGIRVTASDSPKTRLVVRGDDTKISGIRLSGAHLEKVRVDNGAAIENTIELQETLLEANFKFDGATGSPSLKIGGSKTEIETVAVVDTNLRSVGVEDGASVSTLKLKSESTSVDYVTVSGQGTTIDSVSVSDCVEISEGLQVDEATVGKLEMNGAGTVRGLHVKNITIDKLSIEGTCLEPPDDEGWWIGEPGASSDGTTTGVSAAVRVVNATVTSDLTISGGRVDGTVMVKDATVRKLTLEKQTTFAGPVEVCDGTRVERSLYVGDLTFNSLSGVVINGARVAGDLQMTGAVDTEDGDSLRVGGGSVIDGALRLDEANVGRIAIEDARVKRRVMIVGGSTVEREFILRRDAAIEGDFVVGSSPNTNVSDTAGSQTASGPDVSQAKIEGELRLGSKDDEHPTSGGVTVDGSLAVTGTVSTSGITLSDVVVGEDLQVVGAGVNSGDIELFDCIVRGKIRVADAKLNGVSIEQCRVEESVWVGAVDTGRDTDDNTDQPAIPDCCETTVEGELSIVSTPIAENVIAKRAAIGNVRIHETTVNGRVRLKRIRVDDEVTLKKSRVKGSVTVGSGRIGGLMAGELITDRRLQLGADWQVDKSHPTADNATTEDSNDRNECNPAADLTLEGPPEIKSVTIGDNLTLDCDIETSDSYPTLESVDVGGAVRLRPRLDGQQRVNLQKSTLPKGTLVITSSGGPEEYIWYDLREATLGDVTVEFDNDPGRAAISHLLLLNTRYDGFRFSALESGTNPENADDEGLQKFWHYLPVVRAWMEDAGDARLHTLPGAEVATQLDDVPSPEERMPDEDESLLYQIDSSYWPYQLGTGYKESDDPPPAALEQTYLNAKNGARQVGDEDIAGKFFKREKRYRRRRYWEQLCGVGDNRATSNKPFRGWFTNIIFDWIAVYGERPSRVVGVSVFIIALFAGVFWLLLEEPPYGNQYVGSGVLPDWLASGLQPLILSIESFVTLVLVGPADQRLTPLTHLLGQIEGFLGVFLVALFVFTLTRSIRR